MKDELDDRMPIGLLGSTELLTSVYSAGFDFRDELYDDNYQAEAEKFILERFRIFMNNKDVSNTK